MTKMGETESLDITYRQLANFCKSLPGNSRFCLGSRVVCAHIGNYQSLETDRALTAAVAIMPFCELRIESSFLALLAQKHCRSDKFTIYSRAITRMLWLDTPLATALILSKVERSLRRNGSAAANTKDWSGEDGALQYSRWGSHITSVDRAGR